MVKINIKHIIIILGIISIILMAIPNYIYADQVIDGDFRDYRADPNIQPAINKANVILGVIQTVGIASSVIALMIIGIKYMIASVEQKAEYKKTFTPYIIGAFLVFTVSLLPQIIFNLLEGFH